MPELHAKLGPSAAERWLRCPASIQMSQLVDTGSQVESPYALEGTQAHTLAEIKASYYFDMIGRGQYLQRTVKLRERVPEDQWSDMDRYADQYVEFLIQAYDEIGKHASLHLEQRVDTGVPDSWGTADAIITGLDRLHVIDFKYGQGIAVSVQENPQLRLYGLGALDMHDLIGEVETVSLSIFQPRMRNVSTTHERAEDLYQWRDTVAIPAAEEAHQDDARFGPSEAACRFCPAAGVCKPRMDYIIAQDFGNPNLMDPDDIADALHRLKDIREWCKAIEETALEKAYTHGVELPGWKVVRSGGVRKITDPDQAVRVLEGEGYTADQTSRVSMRTLKELDKLVGEERLQEILGDLLTKTTGRESLVTEDDNRPAIDPLSEAKNDFKEL